MKMNKKLNIKKVIIALLITILVVINLLPEKQESPQTITLTDIESNELEYFVQSIQESNGKVIKIDNQNEYLFYIIYEVK